MESAIEGPIVLVKLNEGDDIFASLERVCRERAIESGAVHWGIGMLQQFELGFFTSKGYARTGYEDRHELLAFHGSITMSAEPKFHIHAALARRDHVVVGGHLFRATSCVMNEICLERFDSIRMNRRFNPASTLNELSFE
jgi:predicted DNA-binding protein with PD1-like motif